MEDLAQQTVTLTPSKHAFSFSPHRRRPLRSNTCRTLARILSHCTRFPHPQTQCDSVNVESRPVSEQIGSTNHHGEAGSVEILVPISNCKQFEDTSSVNETTSVDKSKENADFHEGGLDGEQTILPNVDHVDLVIDGEQEATPGNKLGSEDFLVAEDRSGDCAFEMGKEFEDMDIVLDINMDDFGPVEQLEADGEFSFPDFSEAFDSCFWMDTDEMSKAGNASQENGTCLEKSVAKEAEHNLQLKETELEKRVHVSDAGVSSCCTGNEEIEEGEISGEVWVAEESLDVVSEDAVSVGGRNADTRHASEGSFNKEEVICNEEDRGHLGHDVSSSSSLLKSDNNRMAVELRKTAGQTQNCYSPTVFRDSYMETPRIGPITPYLNNLTPPGRFPPGNAAEYPNSADTEKEGDGARQKKRKNGPLTKERRAKKKKKDKIKKAEKNRKLGVKRLKLQPASKPETIEDCRHHLLGRCTEGDKCKFSHAKVPETKSKACVHFARHACMKGDDCPFDHELSKYPCTTYTSTGFCKRGSDCLFKHEMPAKQSSPTTPSISQPQLKSGQPTVPNKERSLIPSKPTTPEVKFQFPSTNSSSSKHTYNRGSSFQKLDAKSCPSENAAGKSTSLLAAKAVPPKGVSFLLNCGTSVGDTSKLNRDGSSMIASDVGRETILKLPGDINKSSNMSEGVPPRKPRGINFLSFAQPSSNDFNDNIISHLLSNSHNSEKGKSVIGGTSEGKQTCSLPESRGVVKVDRLMNQSNTCSVPGSNEAVNRTSPTAPQRLNFFSFDKTRSDNSSLKEHANDNQFNKTSVLSNTPTLVQKAVQSTLAFAAKFEAGMKAGSSLPQWGR